MTENKARIYNCIELYEEYVKAGGKLLLKRQLIPKSIDHFSGDLIALSSPGIATIVTFRSSATTLLRVTQDETDDISTATGIFTKQIKKEINDMEIN